jgi:chromosome segregation ATPase
VQNELTSAKLRFQTAESKVIEMEQMLAEARAIKNKAEHQAEELDRQLRASKQEVSKVELIVESREARILELEEEMKMVRKMTITVAN